VVEGERKKKEMFAQWGSARAPEGTLFEDLRGGSGELTLMSVTLPEWGTARSQVFGKRYGVTQDLSATELQITNQRLFGCFRVSFAQESSSLRILKVSAMVRGLPL
jgi:hypothetical protein